MLAGCTFQVVGKKQLKRRRQGSGVALTMPCALRTTPFLQILRSQGQFRKARHCEICKQQYRIPSSRPGCGRGSKTWEVIKDLVSRVLQPQWFAIRTSLPC